jgi:hypothetical protein
MMDEKESEVKRQASTSYVAPHSASLQRSGDVADRLYHLASVQQKERLERTEVANNLYAYDSTTGEKLFQVHTFSYTVPTVLKRAKLI